MIHPDQTNRLLVQQELLAQAKARQTLGMSGLLPHQTTTPLLSRRLPSVSSSSKLHLPAYVPSGPSDVLTSLLVMRVQNRIRREQLFLLEKQRMAPAVPAIVRQAADHDLLSIKCSSEDAMNSKVVTPLNISRSVSPVHSSREEALPTTSITKKPASTGKKDSRWLATLEELRVYKEEHGDCIVPRGYPENPRLASWVAEQRKQYKLMKDGKQSSITKERVVLLEELGFAWNAQEAAWGRHLSDLKKFRQESGHCNVPLNDAQFPKLGLWVKEQRRHYTLMKQGKQSHMTHERMVDLNSIGFCWDTHEATWLERLRELSEFQERFGSCAVPTSYEENPKLGTWVHHQRRQYKKFKEGKACHITEERIQALEDLGFVWFPRGKSTHSLSGSSSVGGDLDLGSLDSRPTKRQRL